jgi:hypothetical protein
MGRTKGKTSQPTSKRTSAQKQVDLLFISELYVKGYTFREIANKLNENLRSRDMPYTVTFQQIWSDIKHLLNEWQKDNRETISQHVQRELKKLEKMEVELWEQWEQSKAGKRKTTIKGGEVANGQVTGGKLDNRVTESTLGNPKFLELLLTLSDRRAKLLGYDAPIRIQAVPQEEQRNKYSVEDVPEDILLKMADSIQNASSKKIAELN